MRPLCILSSKDLILLFILSSEHGEVNVTFGVSFQVNEQRVSTLQRTVEVVIHTAVVEEESQGVVRAVQLRVQRTRHLVQILRQLFCVCQRLVHLRHRSLYVKLRQLRSELFRIFACLLQVLHCLRDVALHHRVELL